MRLFLLVLLLLLVAVQLTPRSTPERSGLNITSVLAPPSNEGFTQATTPHPFQFPQDHGPHRSYRQEWWYVTGNLANPHGPERFGYQLTLFRLGMTPALLPRPSAWAAREIHLGHLALSDLNTGQFYHFQKMARVALDLAGADATRVWLEDWSLNFKGDNPTQPQLAITAAHTPIQLQLALQAQKPLILQGERGLSRKSAQSGAASHYYSITRLATTGTVTIGAQEWPVQGTSWLDREWSTSALAPDQSGWDWFALQLDDGWEVMFYRMRRHGQEDDPASQGILVSPEGRTIPVQRPMWQQQELGYWESPVSGIRYPSGWRIRMAEADLELTVTPRIPNQELTNAAIRYWEGAVALAGTHRGQKITGVGYVELTGYAPASGR
ncbi:MAG: carotenoid 1,2-hydratase [Magnetococcales bacterium]|nr:carotenoid 1,2-hydratase [Magnetococcales bacterium]